MESQQNLREDKHLLPAEKDQFKIKDADGTSKHIQKLCDPSITKKDILYD